MLHGRCRYDRLGGLSDRGSIQRRHSDEELSCRRCRRPGFPGNGASFQSAGDPFRDPGHSSDGAGSRYVPHRLLDRYGAGKHGWNVSFRDSDRGRRNCPWNFPRRSAAEGIFLRIP